MTTTTPSRVAILDVPGARLHHELRGTGPLVVLVGSPMGAGAFEPLADLLATDHTVLTTDPRGIGRSPLDDPESESTPELRADDLARLVTAADAGPAAVLGSSGGAVTALALAQSRPDLVHTVVAHEPPLEELLDDRVARRAATDHMIATYLSDGPAAAWAEFLAEAGIELPEGEGPGGPLPADADRDPQEVADERRFFLHELRATTRWVPDLDRLRSGPVRVVVGIGEQSRGQVCDLTSQALAAGLGVAPTWFPGDHVGFLGDTPAFAVRLRDVLR